MQLPPVLQLRFVTVMLPDMVKGERLRSSRYSNFEAVLLRAVYEVLRGLQTLIRGVRVDEHCSRSYNMSYNSYFGTFRLLFRNSRGHSDDSPIWRNRER